MKRHTSIIFTLIICLCFVFTGCACDRPLKMVRQTSVGVFGENSNIAASITLVGRNETRLKDCYAKIVEALKTIDQEVSTVKDGKSGGEPSFIYTFNNSTGLNDEGGYIDFYIDGFNHVLPLVERAKEFYEQTDGLFNPAVYPLMELWHLDAVSLTNIDYQILSEADAVQPAKDTIENNLMSDILEHTKFDEVVELHFDADVRPYLNKKHPDAKIDFGGQAKGYGANLAVEIVKDYNIPYAVINIGGNLITYCNTELLQENDPEYLRSFDISINNPAKKDTASGDAATVVTFKTGTVSAVTSGDYERNFVVDGVKYAHILNPKTGYPLNLVVTPPGTPDGNYTYSNDPKGLTSVTIVNPDSELSDVYAKAVILLGMEAGIKFLEDKGISGVLLSHDKVYAAVGDFDVQVREGSLYLSDYTAYVDKDGKSYAFYDVAPVN